jgi:3-dehydroquinate synthase
MQSSTVVQIGTQTTQIIFDAQWAHLEQWAPKKHSIIVTDAHIFKHYSQQLTDWRTIVIPAGETHKQWETIEHICNKLLDYEADRHTTLVGLGGGVVTDITGFAASIYKRGIRFGFLPSTILGMVDAALGGKNGIDVGSQKNMIGIIRQPDFMLYHYSLLDTLPQQEWINGFAEIIKHSCIALPEMFSLLEKHNLHSFQSDRALLQQLIQENALFKLSVVQQDEHEKNTRKLLNFGHTLAHAIENDYALPHGFSVAIGMLFAAELSVKYTHFQEVERLKKVIQQFELPTSLHFNTDNALKHLYNDKKRNGSGVDFIVLKSIGEAQIHHIPITNIKLALSTYENSH